MLILAFDEGAWHPSGWILLLWPLSILVSLIPLVQLARGSARRWGHYAVLALPFFVLFAIQLYVGYGNSGSYTGNGTIGFGAHIDVARTLPFTALAYAIVCAPTLIAAVLAHWTFLHGRAIFVLLIVIQFWFAFFGWALFLPEAAIR